MREFFKKGLLYAFATAFALVVASASVKADSTDVFSKDPSGNVFGAGQSVNVASFSGISVDNELFAAGMDVRADGVDIDGSAFMAGQNVSIVNSTVGGSIFAAGSNVTIDAAANNNIWIAGSSAIAGENTSVKGLHIAAANVVVDGTYDAVSISGSTVTFNGTCNGDMKIEADTVIFGDDAFVGGNLTVVADENPNAEGIVSGEYEFEESSSNETKTPEAIEAAKKAALGASIVGRIKSLIFNIMSYSVLAIVLYFVFRENLTKAYQYSKERAGAHWGFGALITICFPIIAIVTCFTIIGLPVVGIATVLYVLALCTARVFTFVSLGRELIFTHTSKRLHPVAEVVLSAILAAVVKAIPVVGTVAGLACAFYMIGYVCLAFADTIKGNNKKEIETEAEAV